jgi:8-oxo-dGTP pyrophosphatase MutT (NUDIX family)
MEKITLVNLENVSDQESASYRVREAARAIVFDDNNLVALLHATKNEYYKLPGGGIEAGENKIEALKRECLEEIGCNVEITRELGFIVEYRKESKLKQISYCYIAKLVGEKGAVNLTENEIEEGFKTVWLSLKEALKVLEQSKPITYEGPYMVSRDYSFLKAVS